MSFSSSATVLTPSVSSKFASNYSGPNFALKDVKQSSDTSSLFSTPLSSPLVSSQVSFDNLTIEPGIILPVSRFVASAASLSLRTSVGIHDTFAKSQQPQSCSCPICKKSTLFSLTQTLLRQQKNHPSSLTSPLPSQEFVYSLSNGVYESDMVSTLKRMLEVLRVTFRLRKTELISAVALFLRILHQHSFCFVFYYLFRSSLKTLFLACLILAHKSSSDVCFKSSAFATVFGVPLDTLNHFEIGVLELLDNRCLVDSKNYANVSRLLFPPTGT